MLPIAIFFLILFSAAMLFAWLMDNPGTVTIDWLGTEVTLSMVQSILALAVLVALATLLWTIVSAILRGPKAFDRFRKGRRRDRGYNALSRGLIAAGAGNAPLARQLTKESRKYLGDEPLVAMLDAQTSLVENDRMAARKKFAAMMERDDTRLLGLRGLYLEAEREGASEAAAQYARTAADEAPGTPWATKASLKARVLAGEWEDALAALQAARSSGAIDKDSYNRQRAVLLTARALDKETQDPSTAKADALRAHKLAPDLVPAALVAARTGVRLGDIRKSASVLEKTWRESPHPDIADAYMTLRAGDSASDRLKRAETLNAKRGGTVEGSYAIARAALDTGDFERARAEMKTVLKTAPTERACLLMADIEEAQNGDTGRVREWLSRAVTAPRDPVWTDGTYVSKTWAPISPATGEIDAFEWRVPMADIGGPAQAIDYESLANPPAMTPDHEEIPTVEAQVAAARMKDDAVDAEILDAKPDTRKAAIPPTPPTAKPVPAAVAPAIKKTGSDGLSAKADTSVASAPAGTDPIKDDGQNDGRHNGTTNATTAGATAGAAVANTAGFTTPGVADTKPTAKTPDAAPAKPSGSAETVKPAPASATKPAATVVVPEKDTAKAQDKPAIAIPTDENVVKATSGGTPTKTSDTKKPGGPDMTSPQGAAKPISGSETPEIGPARDGETTTAGRPAPRQAYPRTSEEARLNLDANKDGRLDRSPDDPGVDDNGKPKSKGLLNRIGLK